MIRTIAERSLTSDCSDRSEIKETSLNSALFLLWYCSLCDSKKNSCHFFDQSEVKSKPNMTWLQAFSRARRLLRVLASSCDWLVVLFISVVIGQSDCFGFGFIILD